MAVDARERMLDVKEVAELLQVAPNTVYRLALEDGLPHYRIGNLYRFRLSDIEAWLERQRRGAGTLKELGA